MRVRLKVVVSKVGRARDLSLLDEFFDRFVIVVESGPVKRILLLRRVGMWVCGSS